MRLFRQRNLITELDDSSLVMSSLGGDREAFCEIVSRYQNLLCSLAYSAVGDIKYSEDIAQETFVDAWRKLDTLKDPEKLKAWLCGILRFKVSHYRRKEVSQPVKDASELELDGQDNENNVQMEQSIIKEQEQVLLWQAIDKMEVKYREPLVLFYREQQSVERVASELDLSTDTAKQRLSRGRKLLKRAMITFVEEGLTKSKPGVGFTAGVLAIISSISPPAKAALFGAGATKASSWFKLSTFFVFLASFSGVISSYFGLKSGLAQSRTPRERRHLFITVASFFALVIVYILGMLCLKYFAASSSQKVLFAIAAQCLVIALIAGFVFLFHILINKMKQIRAQERIFNPDAFLDSAHKKDAKQREYKSRIHLFGVPILHLQFGMPENNDTPAIGWIAAGTKAYGLLFAWGGIAIAPISVGIVSVGVVTVGAVGIGLFGIGTIGIGIIGFGASAIGYKTYGAFSALGWESAFSNGFSVAIDAAIAPNAIAAHTNSKAAVEIIELSLLSQHYYWVLAFIATIVIVPSIWHSKKVIKRMKPD